jgi:FkbM family methyltransferase
MALPRKLFTALQLPLLSRLLDDARLALVDIGGRGQALYPLLTLAPFADYFVSEPDPAEAERLRGTLPREAPWRSVTVFDTAIASRPGTARLHITAEPGMSSLLEPDRDVTSRFHLASKFDVASVVDVPAMRLDDAAARYGFAHAAFVKLDTQGTELDILESGPRLTEGPLLGVYAELSFRPFYSGQPVFADVDSHLRRRGFSLCSLDRTMLRRAGYRESLYSKRIVTWAHCLYLREPPRLAGDARPLTQLLALTIAFQHFDLAFETAGALRAAGAVDAADVARVNDEIEQASQLSMRYLLHKREERAAAASPAGDLVAASVRDKSQRD